LIDERYLMHRLKSTSLAGVAGALLMGGWFLYQHYAKDVTRWDLLVILMAMAAIKLGALLYYRFRD
jgi:hypothetical protein